MFKKKILIFFITAVILITPLKINAQNLNSNNYTLVGPTLDGTSATASSGNFSSLNGSSPIDDFTTSSSTYLNSGGTSTFIVADVPQILCAEASTTSLTTSCTGVPGGNGMIGVCSIPGCYDRVKVEINPSNNPTDAKYAIEFSTLSDFSANVSYVSGSTHMIKTSLAASDFLYKCEWEGNIASGLCISTNSTWQKYNILGLTPGTLYYVRASALKGITGNGKFTQSKWGPSVAVATMHTSLTFDIDVGATVAAVNNPPYNINIPVGVPDVVNTSTNYIILRATTNALSGISVFVRGANGLLNNAQASDTIPTANADLSSIGLGYGLRNDSSTNSQINSGLIGNVTISASPTDFTDTGAVNKVGGPSTTLTEILNSSNLPLNTGVAGFKTKVRTSYTTKPGTFTETLTFMPVGTF